MSKLPTAASSAMTLNSAGRTSTSTPMSRSFSSAPSRACASAMLRASGTAAGGRVARRFFHHALRPKAPDERDQLPHLIVRDAHRRHLRAGNAEAYRGIQLRVPAAVAVETCREIGSSATFAGRSVTVRAVRLKQR